MIPGRRYTPEDILKIALRYKWLIVVPMIMSSLAAAGLLYYLPNKYRSETVILVVPQRVPESYVRSTVTSRIEDRLQSIRQQILSRTRLERIILDFDLYPENRKLTVMEDIVAYMRHQVTVDMVRGDAFVVSYIAEDPALAQKVTERLASLVMDENLRDRAVVAEETNQFIETQLEEARARLETHEKKLEVYRRAHMGQLPSQAEANMQAVNTLQAQAQGLLDSIARDRDRLFIVEREISDMPARIEAGAVALPTPTAPPAMDGDGLPIGRSASERLAAARAQLRQFETRLKPEHPDMVRIKSIIRDLELKSADEKRAEVKTGEPAGTPPPSQAAIREAQLRDERAMLTRQITQKDAQIAAITTQIASYQSRLDAAPTRESEMIALMRDYETLKTVYTDLLKKREDSKVASNLEQRQISEQFKILDPANRPELPFSPNRPLIAAAGLAGGLGMGIALVLLLELRDKSFRSDTDIQQALGLPVLAMIPHMSNSAERARHRRLILFAASAAVVTFAVALVVAMRLMQE